MSTTRLSDGLHLRLLTGACAALLALAATPAARAQVSVPQTYTVDRADDDDVRECTTGPNDCTFRGALNKALEGDIIVFDPTLFPQPPGPYDDVPDYPGPTVIQVLSPLPPITFDVITVSGSSSTGPGVILDGTLAGDGVSGLVIEGNDAFVRGIGFRNFGGDGVLVHGARATVGGTGDCTYGEPSRWIFAHSNGGYGVHVTGASAAGTRLDVMFIGEDEDGAVVGNAAGGVLIDDGATDTRFSGGCFRVRGNHGPGVTIAGSTTTGTRVDSGDVGLLAENNDGAGLWLDGAPFDASVRIQLRNNAGPGVLVTGGAENVRLSQGTITGNADAGVRVEDGARVRFEDSINVTDNGGLAFDLVAPDDGADGVTPNDDGDADSGPNGLLNFPVIERIDAAGNSQVVVHATACAGCTVRFYRASDDPSGHGELGGFMGRANADANGVVTFQGGLAPGLFVTATATDSDGNMSELAANVQGPKEIIVDRADDELVTACTDDPDDCSFRGALTIAKHGDSIAFDTTVFPSPPGPYDPPNPDYVRPVIAVTSPLPSLSAGLVAIKATRGISSLLELDGSAAGDGVDGLVIDSDDNQLLGLVIRGFDGDGLVVEGANNTISNAYCEYNDGEPGVTTVIENGGYGLVVRGAGATNNNIAGVHAGRTYADDSDHGNGLGGVLVTDGATNTRFTSDCNNFSRNHGAGLEIRGADVTGTSFQNRVYARNNDGDGLLVDGASQVTVSGSTSYFTSNAGSGVRVIGGAENVVLEQGVAYDNGGAGLRVESGTKVRAGRSFGFYDNAGLGIDLVAPDDGADGVTPNDDGDADDGPNHLLNFPVIDDVVPAGNSQVVVTGSACPGCVVRIYRATPDPTGHGEAQGVTGNDTTAGSDGRFSVQVGLASGSAVTAVALDPSGNMSEFAANVAGPQEIIVDRTDDELVTACTAEPDDCSFRGALTIAKHGDSIAFDTTAFPSPPGPYDPPNPDYVRPVIAVTSPLPTVSAGLVAIKATRGIASLLELDGSAAGDGVDGLVIDSDDNQLLGLVIRGFDGDGLVITGANNTIANAYCEYNDGEPGVTTVIENGGYGLVVRGAGAANNNIAGVYSGRTYADDSDHGNALGGALVTGGATGTRFTSDCNNFSRNHGAGLELRGADVTGVSFQNRFYARNNLGDGFLIDGTSQFGLNNNTSYFANNGGDGVRVIGGAHHVTLAYGIATGNVGAGVRVVDGQHIDVGLSFTINGNGALGIDLVGPDDDAYGVTYNDLGDGDEGPNGLQNFPDVRKITSLGDGRFRISGVSCPSCVVRIFRQAVDPSGYGEAQSALNQGNADQYGVFAVDVSLGLNLAGVFLTLTATRDGSTSEFGEGLEATLVVNQTDVCGNSVVEEHEDCDDGNVVSGDGCSAVCVTEVCGDGIVQNFAGHTELCDITGCDDGDPCTTGERCGDDCTCVAGTETDCDDDDVCTNDYCVHGVGCQHDPIPCADDGDVCTVERCDAQLGCLSELTPVPGMADATCDGFDDDCDGQTDEDYVPAAITCGQGVCAAAGDRLCNLGVEEELCDAGAPLSDTDDTCDGVDDDCSGEADEDYAPQAIVCGVGACEAQGTRACVDGAPVESCTPGVATDEVCNGVDDDCDGLTDAADDTLAAHACEEQRGVCAGAMSPPSLCQGGQWIGCGPAVYAGHAFPSYALDDASCDGRDNDCDGATDEDFAPETITCGVGACAAEGTRTCVAGVPTDACTPGDAADEVCNGEDDDCDGLTDANDDTLTRPLCAEQRGVCAGATAPAGLCQGGAWGDCTVADYAAFAFPSYAVDDASCDGRDNDCDGATDEDFAAVATTCGVGACAGQTGTVTCTSEGPVDSCDALAGASAEVCNGVDDDCDGFVDNVVPGRAGASVCAALETAIASGPDAVTAATEATFTYANPLAAAHDAFECALDGGAWERCDGAPGEKTYGDLAAGTHVFLVRAVGADGAVDATPAYWAWRVDPTVPETTILVGPTDPAQSATARFVFGASVADADFLCAVDVAGAAPAEADWEACDADLVLASLDEGVHHLWVFAVSPLGVADPTPAAWTWHVDTSAPDTVITAGPEALTAAAAASFAYADPDDAAATTFSCRLDGSAWAACDGGAASYDGLGDGAHVFEVASVDATGNTDPAPARWAWTVDTRAPVATIAAGPDDPAQTGDAAFVLLADEAGVAYYCALDPAGGAPGSLEGYESCDATPAWEGLADGAHALYVVARDGAGNVSEEAAVWAWSVDTSVPETTITARPAPVTTTADGAAFAFEASVLEAGFECRLDDGAWFPCDDGTATFAADGLAVGAHVFLVRACAGACDPTPAVASWEVSASSCPLDAEAPVIACPADVTLECAGGGADLTSALAATAEDACGAEVAGGEESGRFVLGDTPIVFTATDGNGNAATCLTVVSVTDTVAPEVTCPADVTVASDEDRCGTEVALDAAVVSDACQDAGTVLVFDDRPATFPVGTTVVRFTAVDAAGNDASCETRVTVSDETPLTLACPAALAVEAPATACAWRGELTATARDNCAVDVTNLVREGSFGVGATTVEFTANDGGDDVTCTTEVVVSDVTAPEVTCVTAGAAAVAAATDACGATVALAVSGCEAAGADGVATELGAACPVRIEDGAVSWDGTALTAATVTVTVAVTATDPSGNAGEASCALVLRGVDEPVVQNPGGEVPVDATAGGGGGCAGGGAGAPWLAVLALCALWVWRRERTYIR